MIATFFPLKKLRRNGKYLLFGVILVVGALAIYGNISTKANAWGSNIGKSVDATQQVCHKKTFFFVGSPMKRPLKRLSQKKKDVGKTNLRLHKSPEGKNGIIRIEYLNFLSIALIWESHWTMFFMTNTWCPTHL